MNLVTEYATFLSCCSNGIEIYSNNYRVDPSFLQRVSNEVLRRIKDWDKVCQVGFWTTSL